MYLYRTHGPAFQGYALDLASAAFPLHLLLCHQPNYLFIWMPHLPARTLLNPPQTNYQSPVFCHLSNLTDTVKKSKLLTAE